MEVLSDGLLRFKIHGREAEQSIDVLLLKLACQEVVAKHDLQVRDELYVPTAAFIKDLSDTLTGLGIDGCTPSIALALWKASEDEVEGLKKNESETPQSDSGSGSIPEE